MVHCMQGKMAMELKGLKLMAIEYFVSCGAVLKVQIVYM